MMNAAMAINPGPVDVDAIRPNDALQAIYLDWWINFLTVERFASYYGLTPGAAAELIEQGRLVHKIRTEPLTVNDDGR